MEVQLPNFVPQPVSGCTPCGHSLMCCWTVLQLLRELPAHLAGCLLDTAACLQHASTVHLVLSQEGSALLTVKSCFYAAAVRSKASHQGPTGRAAIPAAAATCQHAQLNSGSVPVAGPSRCFWPELHQPTWVPTHLHVLQLLSLLQQVRMSFADTTSVSLSCIVHASLPVAAPGRRGVAAASKLQVCCSPGKMPRAAGSGRQPAQGKRDTKILCRRLTALRAWPPKAGTATDWALPCPSHSCCFQTASCSPLDTGWHVLDQCSYCQGVDANHKPFREEKVDLDWGATVKGLGPRKHAIKANASLIDAAVGGFCAAHTCSATQH